MSMIYRINAGHIPENTWIQDAELGGGRIIGEVCHFIDLMVYMSGSLPVSVYASAMKDPSNLDDTVSIQLRFENGSIGTISYFANGSKSLPKEYFEVYRGGTTGILNDFKELSVYGRGKPARKKLVNQDKGQSTMVASFVDAITSGGATPIPFPETYATTMTAFKVLESLRTQAPATISPSEV
jgi:polar amino acid transport system substrate-binding protein